MTALWLLETTPTVLPAATSSRIMRAAVWVFPVPGGPWITRHPPDIDPLIRIAASRTLSSGVAKVSTGAMRLRSAVAAPLSLPCNCCSATAAKAPGIGSFDTNS